MTNELAAVKDAAQKNQLIREKLLQGIKEVGRLRGNRNVIVYGSAFLQKPTVNGAYISITHEDINGYMAMVKGLDYSRGLTLLLHTPGGSPNAAETVVDYLRSKFKNIEVLVPTLAMSAGTMISLGSDLIILGRQSQLGPIDPSFIQRSGSVSALAVLDQFERAKKEILEDKTLAHLWSPILSSLGPSLLLEAQNAIEYSEEVVAAWLEKYMFSGQSNAGQQSKSVAQYFSRGLGANHQKKSHGRRINIEEARAQGVNVEALEENQGLQEAALTVYHLTTIIYETSPCVKLLANNRGDLWIKNSN